MTRPQIIDFSFFSCRRESHNRSQQTQYQNANIISINSCPAAKGGVPADETTQTPVDGSREDSPSGARVRWEQEPKRLSEEGTAQSQVIRMKPGMLGDQVGGWRF